MRIQYETKEDYDTLKAAQESAGLRLVKIERHIDGNFLTFEPAPEDFKSQITAIDTRLKAVEDAALVSG